VCGKMLLVHSAYAIVKTGEMMNSHLTEELELIRLCCYWLSCFICFTYLCKCVLL